MAATVHRLATTAASGTLRRLAEQFVDSIRSPNTRRGTVNLSNPRAIFAGSPPRFTRSRVTYEAYAVSGTSTRPQVDSASFDHVNVVLRWRRVGRMPHARRH
jgi:hypothetical protein